MAYADRTKSAQRRGIAWNFKSVSGWRPLQSSQPYSPPDAARADRRREVAYKAAMLGIETPHTSQLVGDYLTGVRDRGKNPFEDRVEDEMTDDLRDRISRQRAREFANFSVLRRVKEILAEHGAVKTERWGDDLWRLGSVLIHVGARAFHMAPWKTHSGYTRPHTQIVIRDDGRIWSEPELHALVEAAIAEAAP